jgi:hypothetical protein
MAEFEITPEQALELEAQQRILKPGWYGFEAEHLEDKIANSGNPMVVVRAKGIEGEAKGVTVFIRVLPQFAPIFVGFSRAMGAAFDPKSGKIQIMRFDNSTCKSKKLACFITPDTYEGEQKNNVTKIMPYSELVKLKDQQTQAPVKPAAKK